MTAAPGGVTWPVAYLDPETGEEYGWSEEAPRAADAVSGQPCTRRDLARCQAAAAGEELGAYLRRMDQRWRERLARLTADD